MLTDLFARALSPVWESLGPSLAPLLTSFFSVLVGALPFMVIAAFASGILEVFVSKDAIARLLPRSGPFGVLGVLLAPVLGLAVPMCECGIVPVARRMVQKGVPAATAITFMLANPILNPLSIYSTYLAFPKLQSMVWLRVGLAYVVAVTVGLILHVMLRGRSGEELLHPNHAPAAAALEGAHTCECDHDHDHSHHHTHRSFGDKVQDCLEHAASEFFDVTKYFIIGAGLAAIFQTYIDRSLLETLGGGPVASVVVMVAFAYVICICSEADAFVAATFASTFTPGALLGFLVAGPMTDIKNTLMMSSAFQRRLVIWLNVVIIGLTLLLTIGLNFLPDVAPGIWAWLFPLWGG